MGAAALALPYYRGADDGRAYILPFPHLIYRGERVNVDQAEIRGRLFRSPRLKLDLSLAGGVPVPSDGDGPRSGMPDLDPTGEVGPELDIRLWDGAQSRRSLWLTVPVRAVLSVGESGIGHQGWTAAPFLEYRVKQHWPRPWNIGISLGPLFGDHRYHGYFYGVSPEFATPLRPAYRASSGYSGTRATLTARRRFGNYWVGAFARYDTLAGAEFEDSPLVETSRYRAVGIAVAWVLMRSERSAVERD